MFIKRVLDLNRILQKKSHFLFGPRGTGKTRLIKETLSPGANLIDLLSDDTYSRLLRRPSTIEELLAPDSTLTVIDEIQKIPSLLDEVHRLIEEREMRFLLTGSSARKLRRGGANLLGGRAWELSLFPLTSYELGKDFDLLRYLNSGGLPSIYFSDYPEDELKNYVKLYIKEEIQAEALVKRLDHFVRFIDVAALSNGEEQNFESIASDSGVPSRTVASYFEILKDTLIGFEVLPFRLSKKRKAVKKSKFFLFDVGIAGALAHRGRIESSSELFGRALEHFIMQELRAFLGYHGLDDLDLCYWRTTSKHEVDIVVGNKIAIEVKASEKISDRHLSGLKALEEEHVVKRLMVVSQDPLNRHIGNIELIHWRDFLKELWEGSLIAIRSGL